MAYVTNILLWLIEVETLPACHWCLSGINYEIQSGSL